MKHSGSLESANWRDVETLEIKRDRRMAMADAERFLAVMSNPVVRDVFEFVAKRRLVRLRDLPESLQTNKEETKNALDALKEAELIREEAAPIDDFSTYYVTATGLSAERMLSRLAYQLGDTRR